MFYNELCSHFQKPQFLQRIIHRVAGSHFETFLAPGGASGGAKPSRAEPGRDGPSRAEPSRAWPSRAMPRRAEPRRAEPSRAEPSRAEPGRAEPSRAEPSRAKPSRSEPGRAEPEPSRAETSPKAVFCHRRAPKSIQKPVPPKPEINQNVPNMPKLLPNGLSHLFLFKTPVFFFTGWGCPKGGSIVRELIGRPHIYIYIYTKGFAHCRWPLPLAAGSQ